MPTKKTEKKGECKVYVVGNFKGGVGKTKLVTMLSYLSASKFNRRTLVVDMDPQGNASRVLAKTANIDTVQKSITTGFENGNLEEQIVNIKKNLDMIPSNTSFRNLTRILLEKFPENENDQIYCLKELLKPIKENYDAIYIDVPPTISDFSDNAMLASDYCIIVLQTQELSLDGVKTYIGYMQYLSDNYNSDLNVLGIVPMMLRPGGRVDEKVMEQAKELYGGNVLSTIIKYQERLKVYDVEGITSLKKSLNTDGTKDVWDTRAHNTFSQLLKELDEHEIILEEYQKKELIILKEKKSAGVSKKNIEPLIKKRTTLKDKEVNIKGTDDFKRRTSEKATSGVKVKKTKEEKEQEAKDLKRKTTMKTQKTSLDVLLKLEILDPFLRSTEDLDVVKNISINEKIDLLIEAYIHSKLSARQIEGFRTIYDSYTK